MPSVRTRRLLRHIIDPDPSFLLACLRITLVLLAINVTLSMVEALYDRHAVDGPVPGLQDRGAWFFVGGALLIAPLLETAMMAVMARVARAGRRPGLFVALTAALAVLTHPPFLPFRMAIIGGLFAVMAAQMVVWSRERTATLAFWGVATTHALYNAGLLALGGLLARISP